MSAITIALQAARVERGDIHAGPGVDGTATQVLQFIDDDDTVLLVMTLTWPWSSKHCPVVLMQDRESGPRD